MLSLRLPQTPRTILNLSNKLLQFPRNFVKRPQIAHDFLGIFAVSNAQTGSFWNFHKFGRFCIHFRPLFPLGLANPAGSLPHPSPEWAPGMPYLGRGLWTPPLWGFCRHILSARGSQGPSDALRTGPFVWGGVVFLCPLASPIFHTHVFVLARPSGFFCLRGPLPSWIAYWRWLTLTRCVRNDELRELLRALPEILRNDAWPSKDEFRELLREFPENPETRRPRVWSGFFVWFRGKCCPFFSRNFFWRLSLFTLRLFRVLSILNFFGGFSAMNFGVGVQGFWGGFLGP